MSEQQIVLGIDLGTTNSCVSIWINGKIETLANKMGHRTTPSMICFTKNEVIVGDAAKNTMLRFPTTTIYGIKRLIGRNFNDKEVQNDMKYWPFKIIKDPNSNKPKIEVEFQNKKQTFFAEEISAKVLVTMKEIAEEFLNRKVKDVVITCPAYFNDLQRKATQMAGKIAGLNVLRIINEPTAAAIAYAYNRKINNDQNILIFDLGGGTFDVSIVNIDGDLYEVKSNCGDMHLGGDDFDNSLVDYCLKELKNKGYDFYNNTKMKTKLKIECEKAKIFLTSLEDTSISLEDIEQEIKISRAEFEEICKDLFNKCIPILDNAIKDAELNKENINEIILVGGSSRIPKIQQIIKEYFGKNPLKDINPDEVVSMGAAIQGLIVNPDTKQIDGTGIDKMVIMDIIPLSLGIELDDGEMDFIIKRNTSIPYEQTKKYQLSKDYNTKFTIKIYQGERLIAKENTLLGEFTISGILPKKKGEVIVEVTFYINSDGILEVKAEETSLGKGNTLKIGIDNVFDEKTIQEMIKKAEEFHKMDLMFIERNKEKEKLIKLALEKKNNEKGKIVEFSNGIITWIRNNEDSSIDEIKQKYQELINYK